MRRRRERRRWKEKRTEGERVRKKRRGIKKSDCSAEVWHKRVLELHKILEGKEKREEKSKKDYRYAEIRHKRALVLHKKEKDQQPETNLKL